MGSYCRTKRIPVWRKLLGLVIQSVRNLRPLGGLPLQGNILSAIRARGYFGNGYIKGRVRRQGSKACSTHDEAARDTCMPLLSADCLWLVLVGTPDEAAGGPGRLSRGRRALHGQGRVSAGDHARLVARVVCAGLVTFLKASPRDSGRPLPLFPWPGEVEQT